MNDQIIKFNSISQQSGKFNVDYTLLEKDCQLTIPGCDFLLWKAKKDSVALQAISGLINMPIETDYLQYYMDCPDYAESRFLDLEEYVKELINLPVILEAMKLKRKLEDIMKKTYSLVKMIENERSIMLKFKNEKGNSDRDIGFVTCSNMSIEAFTFLKEFADESGLAN